MARGMYAAAPEPMRRGGDPFAAVLLPPPYRWLLPAATPLWSRPAMAWGLLSVSSFGLFEQVALRTSAIDQALREAIAAGATQLVTLGAGLDARPWRMPELRKVRAFEVDHPATQAYKRARVEGRSPMAHEVTFVPVDFQHQRLGEQLACVGHDPEQKTVWIMEGVSMYLPPAALAQTLAEAAARSAAGSCFLLTYSIPLMELAPISARAFNVFMHLLGEPFRGFYTKEEIAKVLAEAGFVARHDSGPVRWARTLDAGLPRPLLPVERLVVAERQ
jgi:methyltransferase (TIGR00027 family)